MEKPVVNHQREGKRTSWTLREGIFAANTSARAYWHHQLDRGGVPVNGQEYVPGASPDRQPLVQPCTASLPEVHDRADHAITRPPLFIEEFCGGREGRACEGRKNALFRIRLVVAVRRLAVTTLHAVRVGTAGGRPVCRQPQRRRE